MSADDNELIRYAVFAKRPSPHYPGGVKYDCVGGVWADPEPCENHRAYCTDMAAHHYPDDVVEYVICEIQEVR